MSPPYINEIRYSHLEDLRCVAQTLQYEIAAPGTSFEQEVQSALATARTQHLDDELGLALDGYQQLQALILKTISPQLPVGAARHPAWRTLVSSSLTNVLLSTTAATLGRTSPALPSLPATVINPDTLPADVTAMMAPLTSLGATAGTGAVVGGHVQQAAAAVASEDWATAVAQYKVALQQVTPDQTALTAYLTHDLGVLTVRLGDLAGAATLLQQSAGLFATAKIPEGQVASLAAQADVLSRQGQADAASKVTTQASGIALQSGLGAVEVAPTRSLPVEQTVNLGRPLRASQAGTLATNGHLPTASSDSAMTPRAGARR